MNRPQQENPLGTAEISSLLLKFSIPAIIGMVVNALYNVVDAFTSVMRLVWARLAWPGSRSAFRS